MMKNAHVMLVTGASRGIGRAIARAAAAEGITVVANFRFSAEAAQALIAEITDAGGLAYAVQADVSDPTEARRLVEATLERCGRLDSVVNNAGIGDIIGQAELDFATFERTLKANLLSAFSISQAAIPHMRDSGGRLIFMSSGAARTGGRTSAAYAAAKAGVEGLMHYYATYLRPQRITANAIAPSLIESDMVARMPLPPLDQLPLGRLGRPDEIWPAVRMILETEYLTGQTIHIDAGRTMT